MDNTKQRESGQRNSGSNLKNKIKKYKYVSFDVFDTLILRDVAVPRDVFRMMEKADIGFAMDGFCWRRIEAEKNAAAALRKNEVTLDEIYSFLSGYTSEERELLKHLEVKTEMRVCRKNPDFDQILDYCEKNHKKIIIISDMYLSGNDIGEILKREGISYHDIFVSADWNARKSRGGLFDLVVEKLGIEKQELLHIGDNIKSDFWIPRLKGISSFHYKRGNVKGNSELSVNQSIVYALSKNNLGGNCGFYHIGYSKFGPLLVGMCQWIHDYVKKSKLDKIHFFSRDGLIVMKAYEKIYGSDHIDYIYVSRRSLTVPQLVNASSMRDILQIVPYIKREETPKHFLHKIGIEDKAIEKELKERFGNVLKRSDILGKYSQELFKLIEEPMKINAENERKTCIGYLRNYYKPSEKIAVVDIGWYGTMQLAVQRLLREIGIECSITGLYLGLLNKEEAEYHDLNALGYVYDYRHKECFDSGLVYGFNGLIETFFSAAHGSAKKYKQADQEIVPVLEESVETDFQTVREIQNGALAFVMDYMNLTVGFSIDLAAEEAYEALEKLMTNPDREQLKLLGELMFYDVYLKRLVDYKGIFHYLYHPWRLVGDLVTSDWKCGFIKKLLPFGVHPPKVYKFMLGMKDIKK